MSDPDRFDEPQLLIEAYRPTQRPPMARLTIFDDGSKEGEIVRLRLDSYTVGQTDCAIQFPHDPMVDSPHLKISRVYLGTSWTWIIEDKDSRTGLWMRVRRIELRPGTEFLLGRNRYRFLQADDSETGSSDTYEQRLSQGSLLGETLDTNLSGVVGNYPSIETLDFSDKAAATRPRVFLIEGDYWIGRSFSCEIRSSWDTFLAEKHCRIHREGTRWFAETQSVPNGMWIRTKRIPVESSASFQIGEQRLRLTCRWQDD